MFGVTEKYLQPIHDMVKSLEPEYNQEQLGSWGILFLCCGAMAGSNGAWYEKAKNSETYVSPSDIANLLQGSDVCTSDDYALKFSECIKKWCNDSTAMAVAEKRMEKYIGKMSDSAFLCNKTWLTLAFILNSLHGMSKHELLGFDCQSWVCVSSSDTQIYGWPELFFTAGLLLSGENSVRWEKMASAIHGMNKPYKDNLAKLFEHYSGKNLFSKSGSR